jgi:hypothetical protein
MAPEPNRCPVSSDRREYPRRPAGLRQKSCSERWRRGLDLDRRDRRGERAEVEPIRVRAATCDASWRIEHAVGSAVDVRRALIDKDEGVGNERRARQERCTFVTRGCPRTHAAWEGRAATVVTTEETTIRTGRDIAVTREEAVTIVVLRRSCDRDFVRCDTATDVGLEHARVSVGRVAVEEVHFSTFVRSLTGSVQKDEVHNTGHSVRTVNGRSTFLQDLRTRERTDRNGVDVRRREGAATVDEDERVLLADSAQVDERRTVTAVGVVLRRSVTDKRRQLTQTFHRGVRALLLQDSRGVDSDRQRRFRLCRRDVRAGDDHSVSGRRSCSAGRWVLRVRIDHSRISNATRFGARAGRRRRR